MKKTFNAMSAINDLIRWFGKDNEIVKEAIADYNNGSLNELKYLSYMEDLEIEVLDRMSWDEYITGVKNKGV